MLTRIKSGACLAGNNIFFDSFLLPVCALGVLSKTYYQCSFVYNLLSTSRRYPHYVMLDYICVHLDISVSFLVECRGREGDWLLPREQMRE